MKLNQIRKAIAGFLIPVVPAVTNAIVNGWSTANSILVGIAVLTGAGVYGIPNAKPE